MKEKIIKLIDSPNPDDVILGIHFAYKHITWEEFDNLLNQIRKIFKQRRVNTKGVKALVFVWGDNSFIFEESNIWRLLSGESLIDTKRKVIYLDE